MMEKNKKRHTILVIEDEEPILRVIIEKLSLHNFNTITAGTIEDALNTLQDEARIDAVWLDHYLPGGKSGIDFVRAIKKSVVWKHLPIFVVSNTAGKDKIKQYREMGITQYFVKVENHLGKIVEEIETYLKQAVQGRTAVINRK